jgi:hypothetical protein
MSAKGIEIGAALTESAKQFDLQADSFRRLAAVTSLGVFRAQLPPWVVGFACQIFSPHSWRTGGNSNVVTLPYGAKKTHAPISSVATDRTDGFTLNDFSRKNDFLAVFR